MGEWRTVRVADVANVTDYVANGSFEALRKNVTYRGEPDYAVLVRLVDHNAGWNKEFVYVDKASYDFLSKSSLKPADIVIANVGANAGSVFRVPDLGMPMTLGPNAVLCRPKDTDTLRQDFLYYFLIGSEGQESLRSILSGSAQPKFNKTDFRALTIPLPPVPEQRAIASTLGVIDDKIELNRRMNGTLEAMARTIFKDWFVTFGPTRAKMETHPTYLAPEIWRLFPNTLDDHGIPKGWEASTIGREVDVLGGSTPSTKQPDYWGGEFCWATPKDLSTLAAPVLLGTERQISKAGLSQISSGLLPSGTVLLSSRAPIGYLVIAMVPTAVNQGFIAMACRHRLSNVFVWLWTQENMETILQNANGSTFQEISKSNFRPISVTVPSQPVLAGFNALAGPIFEHIVANERESRSLSQTRDFLLPKLMSGEIRMREAEKMAEAAL